MPSFATRVKICGITNLEDALHAIRSGADALGFVFYEDSPRYIRPEDAKKIIKELPPFVEKVGLFVNHSAEAINTIAKETGITLIQLHFEADEILKSTLKRPYISVIRAQKKEDLQSISETTLVDVYSEAYGGSGKRLNLEWFEGLDCSKIILAGGLDHQNVGSVVKNHNFYGVDVSSGTEASKGIKDPKKVAAFIKEAKQC